MSPTPRRAFRPGLPARSALLRLRAGDRVLRAARRRARAPAGRVGPVDRRRLPERTLSERCPCGPDDFAQRFAVEWRAKPGGAHEFAKRRFTAARAKGDVFLEHARAVASRFRPKLKRTSERQRIVDVVERVPNLLILVVSQYAWSTASEDAAGYISAKLLVILTP
jgi:hypothetical protein